MYILIKNDNILKIEGNIYIPKDENNRDYKEYLEWVAQGNTPEIEQEQPISREQLLIDAYNNLLQLKSAQQGYSNILNLVSYILSSNEELKFKAQTFIQYRNALDEKLIELKDSTLSIEDCIAALHEIT